MHARFMRAPLSKLARDENKINELYHSFLRQYVATTRNDLPSELELRTVNICNNSKHALERGLSSVPTREKRL